MSGRRFKDGHMRFRSQGIINDMELVASDPDDVKFLLEYMMEGR